MDLEVKVLESLEDDAHSDVQQSVELQDEDGINVVAVPEAQAHQAAEVGGDQYRASLCRGDLNFKG